MDAINFKNYDRVLSARNEYPNLKMTINDIQNEFRDIKDLQVIVDKLLDEQLLVATPSRQYKPYIMITESGQRVVRNGGYEKYLIQKNEQDNKNSKIKNLEFKILHQTAKNNSWQFWIMIIAGLGGIISFLILIYQFLLGQNGFLNDVFSF